LVCREDAKVRVAVNSEGQEIHKQLLKDVVDVFVEIGMGKMDAYEEDFEAHILRDTAEYYSCKASRWILEDSYTEYILKARGIEFLNTCIQAVSRSWWTKCNMSCSELLQIY
jgi:cullin 1